MVSIAQRSFAGGEIAPALYARVDQTKYQTGLRTLRNYLVMRHGGATNRAGTQFIAEVKDSSKTVRLIPFVFNSDQTYILEFGDLYMRVYRAAEQLALSSQNITAITNANPAVLTYAGADTYANGDEVYVSGIVGPIGTYLNGRSFKVAAVNAGANTFQLTYLDGTNVNSTSMGAYTSGGTIAEVYEISTPYTEADLMNLQFVQSADVVTIVHPDYAPRDLERSGHTSWTLTTITFAPDIDAPTGQSATQNGATGATSYSWKITAIADETYEESLPSSAASIANGNATLSAANNVSVSWSAVTGATEYNVYRAVNGVYGFIGTAVGTSFTDTGITPDTTDTPPTARNPFSSDYPSTVTYYQQRLMFANTNADPEKTWGSRTGQFKNFTISSPLQDDDAVTFVLAGKQVNSVKHLIDLGKLIVMTVGGAHVVQGDSSGILKPTVVNPVQQSYYGSGDLSPILIGNTALYLQSRGSIIRDLTFDLNTDGYTGNDLTIFSAHLFEGYSMVDWAYQETPHSVVWVVRDDGVLLGLTYVREHQLLAWHHHDFSGTVENVCVVPEGDEDGVYIVVNRTIDGDTKRYIERINTRRIDDIVDSVFVDSCLTYDGRNTGSTTMTLSGGTTWESTETLTLTASAGTFVSGDVGNSIFMYDTDGSVIRCEITAYTNTTIVSVQPNRTVPVTLRSVAITDWSRAVDEVTGLWHIEGETVSVFADGLVVASANNEAYTTLTVTNGSITLDQPYAVIHVGLPITADIETLDIDTAQGETVSDKKKLITAASVFVEKTRGLWVGAKPPTDDDEDPLENLREIKIRNDEDYDDPVALATETVDVDIKSEWNSNGRIFIRQVDPLPASILAVVPSGLVPFRG